MIGIVAVTSPNAPAVALPSWFSWWSGPFDRSWMLDGLSLGTPFAVAGGLLWLVAGVALVGAGLGYLGLEPLRDTWPSLALVGGGLGLAAVALYFHPLYVVALVINVALVAVAWSRLGTSPLGS